MKKFLLATVMATGLAGYASAAPQIAAGSELSLDGTDTFTATQVDFINPANIGGTAGSFAELANCTGCVTMTTPLTAATVGAVYTLTDGVDTSDFKLTSAPAFATGGTPALPSLTVTASGTMDLTGFAPTPGLFELTTQGPGGAAHVTFSATSIPVPEPGSLAVLGIGLLGLAFVAKRRIRN